MSLVAVMDPRSSKLRFVVLAFGLFVAQTAIAQERTTSPIARVLDGRAPRDVAELKAMQEQIQSFRKQLFRATVSVQVGSANGSGVIVSSDGYVLTAAHVVGRPDRQAMVYLSGKRSYARGRTLGINQTLDAGMIKITEEGPWDFVSMGSSQKTEIGDWCVAAGYPGGYDQQRQPVLRIGRVLGKDGSAFLSDCTLSGGDSGGPLVNLEGKLIGIHSRIGAELAANLHVPVDNYSRSWKRLAQGDAWDWLPGSGPFIGVVRDRQYDRAVVRSVRPNSPAANASIRSGDVIVRVAERTIGTFSDLQSIVRQQKPGNQIEVTVVRKNERIVLPLIVGDQGG